MDPFSGNNPIMFEYYFKKIIDVETGKALGPNKVGEILVRGPQIMLGYLNNPKATAETLDKDGFLHSGGN